MYIDEFVFTPTDERFARRDGNGRTPFVIWKPFSADPNLKIGAVVGKTWFKAIQGRWMVAEGEYVDHPKYGPQLEMSGLRIAATPYHEALARAISRRIRPYRRSNEAVVFDWIRHLSLDDVLRLWNGDTAFLTSVECGEQEVKDTLMLLASQLRSDKPDEQAARYCGDKDIKVSEWWRYLCWGGLLKFSLSEIGALLATKIIDIEAVKKDPYITLPHRQDVVENPRDYVSWFDWIDYVARVLKLVSPERRNEAVVMAAILTKSWEERSIYVQARPLADFIQSDDFYIEQYQKPTTADIVNTLRAMQVAGSIVIDKQVHGVYPRERFETERTTAALLCSRFKSCAQSATPRDKIDAAMKLAEAEMTRLGKPLTPKQVQGLALPFNWPVSLLTGLPGTGKTTTLRAIVHAALTLGWSIGIAAPTGIASKNCSRSTGHAAWTVHRLFKWREEGWVHTLKAGTALDYDLLIVDEASMLSLDLLHTICNGINPTTRILFVGDPEQLLSVMPGCPFRDMIAALLARIHLTEIQRQAAASGIIQLAHDIAAGAVKPLSAYAPEVRHIPVANSYMALDKLMTGLPKAHTHNLEEFQILTPTNVGELGTVNLNKELATALNPGARTWLGYKSYKPGDKILVTRNDWKAGVFNGELGTLHSMGDKDATLDIFGAEAPVSVSRGVLTEDVDLGYAVTIHKAQGSEFDWVALALDPSFGHRLYKNLLYTAVTRGKKRVDLICDETTFRDACSREEPAARRSQLARWIKEQVESHYPKGVSWPTS